MHIPHALQNLKLAQYTNQAQSILEIPEESGLIPTGFQDPLAVQKSG